VRKQSACHLYSLFDQALPAASSRRRIAKPNVLCILAEDACKDSGCHGRDALLLFPRDGFVEVQQGAGGVERAEGFQDGEFTGLWRA